MNYNIQSNYCSQGDYEVFTKTQQRRSIRNHKRAMELEIAMFDWRSRHLILVLTLTYKPEWMPFTTLEQLQRDRDTFFNNTRFNQLLRAVNGYVWKIEEGEAQGGLHMHIVIFYGGECRADIYYAKQIGQYWANVVTRGRGDYWNSNARKNDYAYLPFGDATGQINRNDHTKRESLRKVLGYLAKDDQQVSSRTNPHCRMFGTSQLPS